jgi:hypothetical protein
MEREHDEKNNNSPPEQKKMPSEDEPSEDKKLPPTENDDSLENEKVLLTEKEDSPEEKVLPTGKDISPEDPSPDGYREGPPSKKDDCPEKMEKGQGPPQEEKPPEEQADSNLDPLNLGGEEDFNFRTPPSSPRGAKRRETPTQSGGTPSPSRSGRAKSHEEDVDPIHEIRNFAYSTILRVPPKKRSSSVVAPPVRDMWNAFPSYDRGFKVKVVPDKRWTKVPREPRKDPDAESQEESEEESTDTDNEKTKSDESGPEEPPEESVESEAADSEAVIDDVEEDMDLELEMETKEAKTKNKVTWLKYGHNESSSSDGDSET